MNCVIPFESKLKFDGPVKEICTISLEHEITENDKEILGNFIISGTYKEHELSVNTFDFRFTVPFEVELSTRIASETLDFAIDNFTYDFEGDEMTVNIDYVVSADELEEREDDLEDLEDELDEVVIEADPLDLIDEKVLENSEIEPSDSSEEDERDINEIIEITKEEKENISSEIDAESVTKQISGINPENDYISFKIHLVKEEESIESICLSNKIDKDELLMLNDISSISAGDKILIPIQK